MWKERTKSEGEVSLRQSGLSWGLKVLFLPLEGRRHTCMGVPDQFLMAFWFQCRKYSAGGRECCIFTAVTECLEFQVLITNFMEKPKQKLPRTQNPHKSVNLK